MTFKNQNPQRMSLESDNITKQQYKNLKHRVQVIKWIIEVLKEGHHICGECCNSLNDDLCLVVIVTLYSIEIVMKCTINFVQHYELIY